MRKNDDFPNHLSSKEIHIPQNATETVHSSHDSVSRISTMGNSVGALTNMDRKFWAQEELMGHIQTARKVCVFKFSCKHKFS